MKFLHPFFWVLVLTFCVANAFALEELKSNTDNDAVKQFVASGTGPYELSLREKIESKSVLYTGGSYTFYFIPIGFISVVTIGFLRLKKINIVQIDPGPEEGFHGLRQHRA
jgi:hypothetical protein